MPEIRKVEVTSVEVTPNPEPAREPFDPHLIEPLDDEDDGRWLDPADFRRLAIERRRGRPFDEE